MSTVQESPPTSRPPPRAGGQARAAPVGADRLLLPHARVAVRGRGRRAGDADPRVAELRPLRGPRRAALVALPHRDERVPRHAERAGAPRAADGSRAVARAGAGQPEHAARGDVDPADPRQPGRARGRSGRRRSGARDDPARVRRRAAASAAAPARGADPVRGAALAGDRGRRAARDQRRVGQQRAAAGARDDRGDRPRRRPIRRRRSTRRTARCSPATSRRSSSTTSRRSPR